MKFQDDIPSTPIDKFKDHHVLVFDLTSMQKAIEKIHYLELVGEPLRLELNYIFPPEHLIELMLLGEQKSSDAIDKFVVVGKISRMNKVSLLQITNRMPQVRYRYRGFFPLNTFQLLTMTLLPL